MKVVISNNTYRDTKNFNLEMTADITGTSLPVNYFTVDIQTKINIFTGRTAYLYSDTGLWIMTGTVSEVKRLDDNFVQIRVENRIAELDKIILSPKFYNNASALNVAADCGINIDVSQRITGYCPQQTARERATMLATVTGTYWNEGRQRLTSSSVQSVYFDANNTYRQPYRETQKQATKFRAVAYSYREDIPTETDEWVEYNGSYYIVTKTEIETGSTDPDAKTVDVSNNPLISTDNVSSVLQRLANYHSTKDIVTGDLRIGGSLIYPGNYVNMYFRENQRVQGQLENVAYSQGGELKGSVSLVNTTTTNLRRVILSCQCKWKGGTRILQTFEFWLIGNYSITMPDLTMDYSVAVKDDPTSTKGQLYGGYTIFFSPIERVVRGTASGVYNYEVCEYEITKIIGDEGADIMHINDRGQYPRKFIQTVINARNGHAPSQQLLESVGVTDYKKTYYDLYNEAWAGYNELPESPEKIEIYSRLFAGGLTWAVDGGDWLAESENFWEFDEDGSLRFPSEFANTLARARQGDPDAVRVFGEIGLSRNDLFTMTDDEIFERWKDSYLEWSNGDWDDDIDYIFRTMGEDIYALDRNGRRIVWNTAFDNYEANGYSNAAYHLYERAGYSREDVDSMSEDEREDAWDDLFDWLVDTDDRDDISGWFFESWTNKKNVKNLINAKEIKVEYNGYYEAETAFSKVIANPKPRLAERTITANGYYFREDGIEGYNKVIVNINKRDWMRDLVITSGGTYEPEEPYQAFNKVNVAIPTYNEYFYKFGERTQKGEICRILTNGRDTYTIEMIYSDFVDGDPTKVYMPIYKNGEYLCDLIAETEVTEPKATVALLYYKNIDIFTQYGQDYLSFYVSKPGVYEDDHWACYAPLNENTELYATARMQSDRVLTNQIQALYPDSGLGFTFYNQIGLYNNRPVLFGGGQLNNVAKMPIAYLDDGSFDLIDFSEHFSITPVFAYSQITKISGKTEFVCSYLDLDGETYSQSIALVQFSNDGREELDLTDFYNAHPTTSLYRFGDDLYAVTFEQDVETYDETIMYENYWFHLYKYENGQFVHKWKIEFSSDTGVIDFCDVGGQLYGVVSSIMATAGGFYDEELPYYSPLSKADGVFKINLKPIKRYDVR